MRYAEMCVVDIENVFKPYQIHKNVCSIYLKFV